LSKLINTLQKLVNEYASTRARQLVVLCGDQAWAFSVIKQVVEQSECLWLGASDCNVGLSMNKAHVSLGQEYKYLAFNAYSGFHPEAFGQSVGTIKGGGVCFIIAPSLTKWTSYNDPDYLRYVASPEHLPHIKNNFLQRIVREINHDEHAVIVEESTELVQAITPDFETQYLETLAPFAHAQQASCVEQIIKVSTGHRNRPLVISADRGRGKSSALGIAAAMLLQESLKHIVITAPKVAALNSVFKHAHQLLIGSEMKSNTLHWQNKQIEFVAPDELVSHLPDCDLLLIDEAAAIPTPMLTTLATHYSRLVFATTIHGYEGTGRGFALRFLSRLKEISPQMRRCELSQPIRWQNNDPLELLSNKLLGLNFKGVNFDSPFGCEVGISTIYQMVSQESLLNDEVLLEQVFGLLVLAHYQTSPSDFRQLLDAPNLFVFIAKRNDIVIGVSLVLKEGELDEALGREIALGKRRLRGHLLPQSLLAQVGIEQAAQYSYARIMRIAVHPQCQHHGIGSGLDEFVTHWANDQGIDMLGSSFGATAQLSQFWFNNDYKPVRLGLNKDSASGTHSLLVLKAINDDRNSLVDMAQQSFNQSFRYDIADNFSQLDDRFVTALMGQNVYTNSLTDFDKYNIDVFIRGARPFEQVSYIVEQQLWTSSQSLLQLNDVHQSIIIKRVLQRQTWSNVAKELSLTGKKSAQALLRQAISAWYKALSNK